MSFTNEDILTLAKAGFTADQIAALSTVQQPAAQPQPDPVPDPIPEETPEPEKTPEEAPKQGASIDDVLTAINSLGKTFQSGFLQGAEQPQPVTAESILAEIINPPTSNSK